MVGPGNINGILIFDNDHVGGTEVLIYLDESFLQIFTHK